MFMQSSERWPLNKLRVWLVMVASWLLGVWAVAATQDTTPTALWMAIDITSAVFVLSIFRPVGFAQKLIGALYTLMVVWHGVYAAGTGEQTPLYTWFQIIIGWAQWGVLMVWSLGDAGKVIAVRLGLVRRVAADSVDNGAD